MKVYTVIVTDHEAEASSAYVFESLEDAESFNTQLRAGFAEKNAYWLTVGTTESPDLIPAECVIAIDEAVAEWFDVEA